ncbi:SIR2 family protein [uncultured Kriegella sp.]|uniref:SIR2 family protein n=1 Tax=uncultured Kriegella sp. TaxID=1798910 RepID=UPI0030DC8BB6|tara:strand:- start:2070 stop:3359 length:1290 start_codon:yes stop_codon:yes gene_type:complete
MTLKSRQWNNLLEALENGSCIVLLGPLISTGLEGVRPLEAQFAKELSKTLEEEEVSFDKAHEENLTYIMQRFMTIDGVTSSDPGYEAKKFYEKYDGQANGIQNLIATLPVNLIINTSPDDAIVQALKQQGKYRTVHDWYNYEGELATDIELPTAESPLVYNLFGYYKDTESLVLTEADQVRFIGKVVKDQPALPPKLLRQFQGKKSFLFLGFNWEHWNLRLLLQSLNLKRDSSIMAHSRNDDALQPKTRDFYESYFRFSFVTDDIEDFVKELHEKYAQHSGHEVAQKKLLLISAPEDEAYCDELYKNLKPLPFESWHRGLTLGGQEPEVEFQKHMANADIILLLVSTDFLASDAITDVDLPNALQRHQGKKAKVVPIITRPCKWDGVKELTQMPLILPKKNREVGKAISTWENQENAYQNIISEIQELL